jgi:RNA polymerase I specific transcription initiation factor RRN3
MLYRVSTLQDLIAPPPEKVAAPVQQVDEMAEKLDSIMLVLFAYLDEQVTAATAAAAAVAAAQQQQQQQQQQQLDATAAPQSAAAGLTRLFYHLLEAFEETTLLTHRSKFVQYLVFYMCGRVDTIITSDSSSSGNHEHDLGHYNNHHQQQQFQQQDWQLQLSTTFTRRLLDVTLDEERPRVVRQSGAAYLASFLARAAFVPPRVVTSALNSLVQWAVQYVEAHALSEAAHQRTASLGRTASGGIFSLAAAEAAAAAANAAAVSGVTSDAAAAASTVAARHKLFYSLCQAAFYVLCFRSGELEGWVQSQTQALRTLLCSQLAPLQRCLSTVRREFARLVCTARPALLPPDLLALLTAAAAEDSAAAHEQQHRASTAAVHSIRAGASLGAAAAAASSTAVVSKAGGLGAGGNPLDAYFPFDPYLLRRSHVYITSMYNYWSGGRGNGHSESSDGEQQGWDLSDDDDSDVDSDVADGTSPGADVSTSSSDDDFSSSDSEEAQRSGTATSAVRIQRSKHSRSSRHTAAAAAAGGAGTLSDSEEMAVSMKLASSYINDSMSCTPASVSPARVGAHWGSMMSSSVSSRLDVAAAALDDFHEVVSAPPSPAVSEEAASHRRASVRKGSIADEGW